MFVSSLFHAPRGTGCHLVTLILESSVGQWFSTREDCTTSSPVSPGHRAMSEKILFTLGHGGFYWNLVGRGLGVVLITLQFPGQFPTRTRPQILLLSRWRALLLPCPQRSQQASHLLAVLISPDPVHLQSPSCIFSSSASEPTCAFSPKSALTAPQSRPFLASSSRDTPPEGAHAPASASVNLSMT